MRLPKFWLLCAPAASLVLAGSCSEPCCTTDGRPIDLVRGPGGELTVALSDDSAAAPLAAVLDTGAPITLWQATNAAAAPFVVRRTLRLRGAPGPGATAPVRAVIRRVDTVTTSLGRFGTSALSLAAGAVLGGDVLIGLSVELAFDGPSPQITIWDREPASDTFLSAASYAVLHTDRHGGGELNVLRPADSLGQRAPLRYPPSRLVLRSCAAPSAFHREDPLPETCCPGDERGRSTGVDLSLLLATGVGPVVLGEAAWSRVVARVDPPPPEPVPGPLHVATSEGPIKARWTKLPRLALVDQEAPSSANPGPCVELARARRLEQVAFRQANSPARAACALPCDLDPRARSLAQNSAAYVEVGADLDVAIIADTEPLLRGIRADVRPEGPEVDGLLGAAALRATRVELDYDRQPARLIFSCAAAAAPDQCHAAARCVRLSGADQTHACFGLAPHGLPRMCDNPALACQ